jgi:hypothetical protein
MNNPVLDRIKRQIHSSKKESVFVQPKLVLVEEKVAQTPIQPEELKNLFMAEITETPSTSSVDTNHKNFDGIEEFVAWYLPLRDKFSENQIVALTTLVQAREVINVGCACKKTYRKNQANNYFKTFWLNNQNTDLPSKVLEVGQFASVTFLVDGGQFLTISVPTPENS